MTSTTHPLLVVQWKIVGHPRRTEHWCLVALTSKTSAYLYQLAGNYDTFTYDFAFVEPFLVSRDDSVRGGCQVGEVPLSGPGSAEWLGEKLKEVRVVRHDPGFDCQNWIMEAIWFLKESEEGPAIIYPGVSERKIREELTEEMERWEVAEDTLLERLAYDFDAQTNP